MVYLAIKWVDLSMAMLVITRWYTGIIPLTRFTKHQSSENSEVVQMLRIMGILAGRL